MPKRNWPFFLFFVLPLFSRCTAPSSSTSPPSSSLETSSTSPTTIPSSPTSSSLDEGDPLEEGLKEVLGEYASLFPRYDAPSYQLDVFEQQGFPTLRIVPYLEGRDPEDVLRDYAVVLRLQDFALVDDGGIKIAQKRVSDYQILVVQAGVEDQDFVLYTYLYQDKLTSWPGEAVRSVLGKDIPPVDAPYFQYQIQALTTETSAILIACYGVTSSVVSEYTETLLAKDYYVEQVYYYYVADKDDVEIVYTFDIENDYFYLQAYPIQP